MSSLGEQNSYRVSISHSKLWYTISAPPIKSPTPPNGCTNGSSSTLQGPPTPSYGPPRPRVRSKLLRKIITRFAQGLYKIQVPVSSTAVSPRSMGMQEPGLVEIVTPA